MAANDPEINAALETAQDRCAALRTEIESFRIRNYPSPAARVLLDLVERTTDLIDKALISLSGDTETRELLSPKQFRLHVHRHTQYFPYLHYLLGHLQGAERENTPSVLIPPLRRLVRACLTGAEVLFTSQPELNYSFLEIADEIRDVFSNAGPEYAALVANFPPSFITITFPSVEKENVLLHCVIAHEVGHGIYKREKLDEALLPRVRINEDELRVIVASLRSSAAGDATATNGAFVPTEVQLREAVTKLLNDTIADWLEEFCSDAIGLALFGPAYYFAFIQFVVSFQALDVAGRSHPAPRLRLRFMRDMMANGYPAQTLGYVSAFSDPVRKLYDEWETVIQDDESGDPIYKLALGALKPVLPSLAETCIKAAGDRRLSAEAFRAAEALTAMIVNLIPPVDNVDPATGETARSGIVPVLNAAWNVYFAAFQQFAINNRFHPVEQRIDAKNRLSEIVLKTIELIEVATRWSEVQNAVKRQGDSATPVRSQRSSP